MSAPKQDAPKCTGAAAHTYDSMGACEAADCPVHRRPKWTQGPWIAVKERESWWLRAQGGFFSISLIGREDSASHPTQANAERIAACMNGCEGIADPSAVPEMLEACRTALAWFAEQDQDYPEPRGRLPDALRAVIAKAEGRT